jgi:hypothetical protein
MINEAFLAGELRDRCATLGRNCLVRNFIFLKTPIKEEQKHVRRRAETTQQTEVY